MATSVAVPVVSELNQAELRSLAENLGELGASIYMPMQRSGPDTRQNPVWLKNLLRQAAEQAEQAADKRSGRALAGELKKLIGSVEELASEPSDGLAIFVRPDFLRAYKIPVPFTEQAVITTRFQVTPLIDYVQGDGKFYVLAVSQKEVRLLEGNKHRLSEVNVDQLPKNLHDALNIDEYVQSIQFHTMGRGRDTIDAGGGIFHGHAGGDQGDKKHDLVEYFRRLDDALTAHFHGETAPMVFAGVDYLFPLYQQSNHYRGLVNQPILGNPEGWGPKQLHEAAWPIVEKCFDADRKTAIDQFGMLAARRQASDQLFEIIENARIGRVGALLLARGARQPGIVNTATGEASLAEADAVGAEDLLDAAASQTLATSGTVYLLDRSEMPTESPIAAIYRY